VVEAGGQAAGHPLGGGLVQLEVGQLGDGQLAHRGRQAKLQLAKQGARACVHDAQVHQHRAGDQRIGDVWRGAHLLEQVEHRRECTLVGALCVERLARDPRQIVRSARLRLSQSAYGLLQ